MLTLRVARDALRAALNTVLPVIPSKAGAGVLLEWEEGRGLTLTANSQELVVQAVASGASVDSGFPPLVLDASRLNALIARCGEDWIFIRSMPDTINAEFNFSRSKHVLNSVNPDKFSRMAAWPALTSYHEIVGSEFHRAVERTAFLTEPDSVRYAMSGVHIGVVSGSLVFVATNGREIGKAEVLSSCIGDGCVPGEHTVIPKMTAKIIADCAKDSDDQVRMAFTDDRKAFFEIGTTRFWSRLVEGRYPKYEDAIPKESKGSVRFDAEPLLRILKLARIMTSEDRQAVDFDFQPDLLRLSIQNPDIGSCEIVMNPVEYQGDPMQLSIAVRQIAAMLDHMKPNESIELHVSGPKDAVVLKTEGYTYVTMPFQKN